MLRPHSGRWGVGGEGRTESFVLTFLEISPRLHLSIWASPPMIVFQGTKSLRGDYYTLKLLREALSKRIWLFKFQRSLYSGIFRDFIAPVWSSSPADPLCEASYLIAFLLDAVSLCVQNAFLSQDQVLLGEHTLALTLIFLLSLPVVGVKREIMKKKIVKIHQ